MANVVDVEEDTFLEQAHQLRLTINGICRDKIKPLFADNQETLEVYGQIFDLIKPTYLEAKKIEIELGMDYSGEPRHLLLFTLKQLFNEYNPVLGINWVALRRFEWFFPLEGEESDNLIYGIVGQPS